MFILKMLSHLPLGVLYVFADVLAFLAHRVVRYRLRVVRHNVDMCLPERSEKERKAVVRKFYHHLADIAVEAVWFGGCTRQRLRQRRIVEVLNPEVFSEQSDGGRSMIILASHLGNWELAGGIQDYNYTDRPFPPNEQNYVCLYKKLSSKSWNEFMAHNRTAVLDDPEHFTGYVETNELLRFVVKHREEQKFYFINTDQRPYRAAKGTVPVTFLGQPCKSMAAAANLALRFGFSIIYQRIVNVSRGHYTIEYVPIPSDPSTTDAQQIMDRYYELLSADIKAQPEQYMWSHNRFR